MGLDCLEGNGFDEAGDELGPSVAAVAQVQAVAGNGGQHGLDILR